MLLRYVWPFAWSHLRRNHAVFLPRCSNHYGHYVLHRIYRQARHDASATGTGRNVHLHAFGAFSTFIAIKYEIGQALDYWSAGGTASAKWGELAFIAPLFVVGLVCAIALSPSITILSFGEDVASGLGIRANRIKLFSTLIVLILTGLSVIVVGPVGFVGLIVPHIMRHLVGTDYRYIIPASALYGAVFLLAADLLGRLINRPHETPLGIIFALVGVPYFLYLVRKQRREFS